MKLSSDISSPIFTDTSVKVPIEVSTVIFTLPGSGVGGRYRQPRSMGPTFDGPTVALSVGWRVTSEVPEKVALPVASGTFTAVGMLFTIILFTFTSRPPASCFRNLDVPPIKVNDKVGNPVMIGAVMVWKVKDTYKAMFDIDSSSISISSNKSFISMGESSELSQRMQNYENFVQIQSDAAIRKIAGMYAYDYNESKDPVTLRSDDGEVAQKLEEELNSRLAIAGIEVLEARINYLAYASEIAGVMLRRQQAEAIIAARERIVEGAVSMVQLALNKLDKDNIVELDEERKAAMVSNLLVVLCADEAAQPVVNTGTLHH